VEKFLSSIFLFHLRWALLVLMVNRRLKPRENRKMLVEDQRRQELLHQPPVDIKVEETDRRRQDVQTDGLAVGRLVVFFIMIDRRSEEDTQESIRLTSLLLLLLQHVLRTIRLLEKRKKIMKK